ncbi:MAG TPA: hypothetical protein VGK34_00480 [Armatimonadota bacterium]
MKPSKISLYFGIVLLAAGVALGILVWLELRSVLFSALSLLPGLVQLGFYRYYCARPRRPGDWQIWVPVMTFLTLGVLWFVVGTWGFSYGVNHKYDHITLSRVFEITDIGFPSGSRLVRSGGIALMHTVLWVKIEMPPRKVDPFLTALNKKRAIDISRDKRIPDLLIGSPQNLKRGSYDWWRPDSAKHFVCAQTSEGGGSGGTDFWLLIDQDQPERAVLYLAFFED